MLYVICLLFLQLARWLDLCPASTDMLLTWGGSALPGHAAEPFTVWLSVAQPPHTPPTPLFLDTVVLPHTLTLHAAVDSGSSVSTGAIIGIAVGAGVVGLGLLGALVWCILKRFCNWRPRRDLYAQENKKAMTPMAANPFWMRGKNANGVSSPTFRKPAHWDADLWCQLRVTDAQDCMPCWTACRILAGRLPWQHVPSLVKVGLCDDGCASARPAGRWQPYACLPLQHSRLAKLVPKR